MYVQLCVHLFDQDSEMTDSTPIRCPACASRLVHFSGWMFDDHRMAHAQRWCPECDYRDRYEGSEAFAIRQVLEQARVRERLLAAADAISEADGITTV